MTFTIPWLEWANLMIRWLHLAAGIAWIGTSFYFIWLDLSLRSRNGLAQGALGESWSVHGGSVRIGPVLLFLMTRVTASWTTFAESATKTSRQEAPDPFWTIFERRFGEA